MEFIGPGTQYRVEFDPAPPVAARPELADVGKLVRRGVRAVVGAARAEDRVTLSGLLLGHLGAAGAELDVVEESWPSYEHVNVQAGLDSWLATGDRTWQLVASSASSTARSGWASCCPPDRMCTTPTGRGPATPPG